MAKWIKDATLLNRTALCKEAKVDRGNLDKFLLRGEIPEQHLDNIRTVILEYGYEAPVVAKVKVQDANKQSQEVKPEETSKTNYTINTIDQLKEICPKKLSGIDRNIWIEENRKQYGV